MRGNLQRFISHDWLFTLSPSKWEKKERKKPQFAPCLKRRMIFNEKKEKKKIMIFSYENHLQKSWHQILPTQRSLFPYKMQLIDWAVLNSWETCKGTMTSHKDKAAKTGLYILMHFGWIKIYILYLLLNYTDEPR